MRATVGDLDILMAAINAAPPVMEAFTTLPSVVRVIGKGEARSSMKLLAWLPKRGG